MEMNKKEQQKMIKWIGNTFCEIMDLCHLTGYQLLTSYDPDDGEAERTFAIKMNYPYRYISLTIGQTGMELYKAKEFNDIKMFLAHEVFHIWHWKYKKMAKSRYISSKQLNEEEEDLADRFSIIISNLLK